MFYPIKKALYLQGLKETTEMMGETIPTTEL